MDAPSAGSGPALEMRKVSKAFGNFRALEDFSLVLFPGEVHCLAGENGSGKSTAIKIVSGVLARDAGRVSLFGQDLQSGDIRRAIDLGLGVIYQDLALFPNLSVVENVAFVREAHEGARVARWSERRRLASAAFAQMGVSVVLDALVEELPIAEKQLVAIARALASKARLIVMDEPTTALTRKEVERLFELVRTLRRQGVCFLFVSHKFEEIFEVCDAVTVLRDGHIVAAGLVASFDRRSLALAMTGRAIVDERLAYPLDGNAPVRLRVQDLGRAGAFKDVTFSIQAGEIVSIVGLMGSGQRELANSLFGLVPADRGSISLDGKPVQLRRVQDALAWGIAMLPEDRLSEGLFLRRTIEDNIVAANLGRFSRLTGWLDRIGLRQEARRLLDALRIKASDVAVVVDRLSGGNQQRVMFARWLSRNPKLIILNSPTVGVDIGSKRDIHEMLLRLGRDGTSILLIADDLAEVIAVSHRVLIMRGGRLVGGHAAADVDEHRLAVEVAEPSVA